MLLANKLLKIIGRVFLILGSFLYPFVVYFALQAGLLWLPVLVLVILVSLRLVWGKAEDRSINLSFFIIGIFLCLAFLFRSDEKYMLFYPVLVNVALLLVFGRSLFKGRTPIIEKIASLKVPKEERTDNFRSYCRKVTISWCLFFILNGSIAAFLALFASRELWMLYTGGVSYIPMGLMFFCEFMIRTILKHRSATE